MFLTLNTINLFLNNVNWIIKKILKIFKIFLDGVYKIVSSLAEVIYMTTEQMVKMATTYGGVTQAELARRLGTTPSNLNQKIKRGTITKEDLERIAGAIGARFECHFIFPDGTMV